MYGGRSGGIGGWKPQRSSQQREAKLKHVSHSSKNGRPPHTGCGSQRPPSSLIRKRVHTLESTHFSFPHLPLTIHPPPLFIHGRTTHVSASETYRIRSVLTHRPGADQPPGVSGGQQSAHVQSRPDFDAQSGVQLREVQVTVCRQNLETAARVDGVAVADLTPPPSRYSHTAGTLQSHHSCAAVTPHEPHVSLARYSHLAGISRSGVCYRSLQLHPTGPQGSL